MGAAVYPFGVKAPALPEETATGEQLIVSGQKILPIFQGKCKLKRGSYQPQWEDIEQIYDL